MRTSIPAGPSLLQAAAGAIRYAAGVDPWTAEKVCARIESLAIERPGGVIAMDADGTLWSGDVGDDLFRSFIQHGRVEDPALEAMRREARDHHLSDAGSGPEIARRVYQAYLDGAFPEERVCELMTWCFAGWTRTEVRSFARSAVEQAGVPSRLHDEVLFVLDRIRRAAIDVVIVSASPTDVVIEAATYAKFESKQVVAAEARFEGEVMLAEVERPIPYAGGKVARLRERIGNGRVLYAAFGDNAFDIPLLASAEVGVAVRPKPRLRQRAHEVAGLLELEESAPRASA